MKSIVLVIGLALLVPAVAGHAQWVKTNLPFGGPVECVCANEAYAFAGTRTGLYRSSNSGEDWVRIREGGVDAVLTLGEFVLVGSDGVFRSDDNGQSWPRTLNRGVCGFAYDGLYLYAWECQQTGQEPWRSSDNGATWEAVGGSRGYRNVVPYGPYVYAIGLGPWLYRSPNHGETWELVSKSEFTSLTTYGQDLFAAGCSYSYQGDCGVFHSVDSGFTWKLAGLGEERIVKVFANNGWVYAGSSEGDVFRSSDKGNEWEHVLKGFDFWYSKCVNSMTAFGKYIFVCREDGIWSSVDNGSRWIESNRGIDERSIRDWVVQGEYIYLLDRTSIFCSTMPCDEWNAFSAGLEEAVVHNLAANDDFLFVGQGDSVCRYDPKSKQWHNSNVSSRGNLVCCNEYVATGGCPEDNCGQIRSFDNGLSWHDDDAFLWSVVEYEDMEGDTSYIGLGKASGFEEEAIFEYDGARRHLNIKPMGVSYECLATSGSWLFAGGDSGVYRYQRQESWNIWTMSWCSAAPKDVTSLFTVDGDVFAGTGNGEVYYSRDLGETWNNVSEGLPLNEPIDMLQTDNKYLYTNTGATHANTDLTLFRCIYHRPLSELVTSAPESPSAELPGGYKLNQNYPNPFNPSTTIKYSLPHAGYVTLRVCNVLGEEVAMLVDGEHAAGTFKATWDASGMPSGVYFCRLTAGGHVQTKKMVLCR